MKLRQQFPRDKDCPATKSLETCKHHEGREAGEHQQAPPLQGTEAARTPDLAQQVEPEGVSQR